MLKFNLFRFSRRQICLTLVAITALGLIAMCWASIALPFLFNLPRLNTGDFCTLEDEVYQTIEAQHREWIEYYRPILTSTGFTSPALVVRFKNGRQYSIDASVWRSHTEMPSFFVVVERSLRRERFGVKGYFFSQGERPSVARLRFQYLHNNTYCYWFE